MSGCIPWKWIKTILKLLLKLFILKSLSEYQSFKLRYIRIIQERQKSKPYLLLACIFFLRPFISAFLSNAALSLIFEIILIITTSAVQINPLITLVPMMRILPTSLSPTSLLTTSYLHDVIFRPGSVSSWIAAMRLVNMYGE